MPTNSTSVIDPKSFIKESYDKFADKKETTFVWPRSMSNIFYDSGEPSHEERASIINRFTIGLSLRKVKTPSLDAIVIDYNYIGKQWGFLRYGGLIINIDGITNIKLEPVETNTDTVSNTDTQTITLYETGFYIITEDSLASICAGKEIELKITGKNLSAHVDSKERVINKGLSYGEKFLFMCRAFYSGLNNDNSYADFIAQKIGVADKKASSKRRVNLFLVIITLCIIFYAFRKILVEIFMNIFSH